LGLENKFYMAFIRLIYRILFLLLPFQIVAQFEIPQMEAYLNTVVKAEGPGAVVWVSQQGKPTYHKAFGMADIGMGVPMDKHYVFPIGNLTKLFTATGLLMLYDEGLFDIEDPLVKFIPQYPTYNEEIIIEQLLSHTSGLPSFTSSEKFKNTAHQDYSLVQLIDLHVPEKLDFVPGNRMGYSNTGYHLLGFVLELLSRDPYQVFLQEELFKPLGIQGIRLDDSREIIKNKVNGYTADGQGWNYPPYRSSLQGHAAYGLLANVEDLAKWHQGMLSGKILDEATLRRAQTPIQLSTGRRNQFGLGWEIKRLAGKTAFGHSGSIPGYDSALYHFDEEELLIVVLTNCDCLKAEEITAQLAAIMLGSEPLEVGNEEEKMGNNNDFLGVYKLAEGFEIQIYEDGGKLMLEATGQGKFELEWDRDYLFQLKNNNAQIEFVKDQNGVTGSLILYQRGISLEGEKIK
jgi:CubicO group peptidase (beta-lactamase class C family)